MRKRSILFSALALASGAALVPSLAAQGGTTIATYSPLPSTAQTALGVSLEPLPSSQQNTLTVTAAQAISAAQLRLGSLSSEASGVAVNVGSFTDDEYTTTNASGVSGLVASNVPAYVVTFSGLAIASFSPNSTAVNTQASVVVNATNGDIIEVFSFH